MAAFSIPRFFSTRPRNILCVLYHPPPRPELEIKLVALGILLHQPRRRLFPRDAVHGDVLVVDAAAVADPGQVAGAGKGDAFVAHAGGGGADEQPVAAVGVPAGVLDQLSAGGAFERVSVVAVAYPPGRPLARIRAPR